MTGRVNCRGTIKGSAAPWIVAATGAQSRSSAAYLLVIRTRVTCAAMPGCWGTERTTTLRRVPAASTVRSNVATFAAPYAATYLLASSSHSRGGEQGETLGNIRMPRVESGRGQ